MSVPASTISNLSKPVLLQSSIKGRVANVRRIQTQTGGLYLTLITVPSPDEYSSPSSLEVQSTKKLAEKGEDITVNVHISGYRALQKLTDKETGEQTSVPTAYMRLVVIES